MSTKSVGRARVVNWKNVCTVLCFVQTAEIYTEQRVFGDGMNFSLSFEANAYFAESYRLLLEA